MKADISDAPQRVNRRHDKRSGFYIVIGLLLGSVATVGALQWANRASNDGPSFRPPTNLAKEDSGLIGSGQLPPRQEPKSAWIQASSDTVPPVNTARQTVFNDRNFVPVGAQNVVPLHVAAEPSPRKEPPQKMKLTIVRQTPSMKERACGTFRQGSIEARNCRAAVGLKYRH